MMPGRTGSPTMTLHSSSLIAAQGALAIENAQAYQMLENLDKSKSQFVRMVTHELRSPIQVASSLLNVLEHGYVGRFNEKQADLVDRAFRRLQFLADADRRPARPGRRSGGRAGHGRAGAGSPVRRDARGSALALESRHGARGSPCASGAHARG